MLRISQASKARSDARSASVGDTRSRRRSWNAGCAARRMAWRMAWRSRSVSKGSVRCR